jgi:hypothetical protein
MQHIRTGIKSNPDRFGKRILQPVDCATQVSIPILSVKEAVLRANGQAEKSPAGAGERRARWRARTVRGPPLRAYGRGGRAAGSAVFVWTRGRGLGGRFAASASDLAAWRRTDE